MKVGRHVIIKQYIGIDANGERLPVKIVEVLNGLYITEKEAQEAISNQGLNYYRDDSGIHKYITALVRHIGANYVELRTDRMERIRVSLDGQSPIKF